MVNVAEGVGRQVYLDCVVQQDARARSAVGAAAPAAFAANGAVANKAGIPSADPVPRKRSFIRAVVLSYVP
jgi:hypothetical protein